MSRFANYFALLGAIALSGCSSIADFSSFNQGGGGIRVLTSSDVTENRTPVDDALLCYGKALSRERGTQAPIGIGVGDVRDFTGRITDTDGAPVTQGAGLMVYSALASLGSGVRIHERLDPRIAELELGYIDRQRLGDGRMHEVTPGADPAPWIPYLGGSILQSDYYIVGGVTELNHTIATGGAEFSIGGIGARTRFIVINVAVDLRIVNTQNLVVEHAVSLQKQVIGKEIDSDVFRFFGTRLFDVKAGGRMTEPLQMAVRSVLQLATLDLLETVSGVRNEACVTQVQPGLERGLSRPSGLPASRSWPPDGGTAVSAAIAREAREKDAAKRKVAREGNGAATPTPATTPTKTSDATPPELPADTGAVVVGAATNSDAAAGVWQRLRESHSQLFNGVRADMVSVNREGGPFLVVVQHPRTAAAEFCETAQAAGIECAVAPPEVLAARALARRSP
jgi:curli biogenesis system outer membrane secretion channel CsgG